MHGSRCHDLRARRAARAGRIGFWRGALFGLAGLTAAVLTPAARAADVREVVSPGGIVAWLVTEPSIPFLSLTVQFKGGAATDPEGRDGLAYMLSGLLDEGAGPYDSQAFRAEMEDNAIGLSFDADRDNLSGSLRTLTETREHAFDLLRLALTAPRFDEEPVERVRQQILTDLTRRETDADYLAARAWFENAFAGHPYARPTRGRIETISGIGVADLERFVEERLARDTMTIGVAGDITPEELAPLLDSTFGALPAHATGVDLEPAVPATGRTIVTPLDNPQSVVVFGHGGIARKDPDYYPAYVANYILGGGGFSSWLTEEVREKRGLAYSVYSYLYDTDFAPLWMGGVATRNDQVAQSLRLIREQIDKMRRGDLEAEDLADAKTYLTGSFPLRLTSNDQIARTLVGMQVYDLGIDYLDTRNAEIEAVTMDDVKRAAARLLAGDLLVSVVGAPQGLDG
ncbi:MAG: insulinase family protein [Geminicoccaceae bacterium]|nr:insulinase family protein [Geminicoccaceae bacterium]